jgi:hypothetical protein
LNGGKGFSFEEEPGRVRERERKKERQEGDTEIKSGR